MYGKYYSTIRTLTASEVPAHITGSVYGLSWHVCTFQNRGKHDDYWSRPWWGSSHSKFYNKFV